MCVYIYIYICVYIYIYIIISIDLIHRWSPTPSWLKVDRRRPAKPCLTKQSV